MAISAFILIDVAGDHTKSAYKTIARISGVKAIYPVTGAHDIIVHVETDNIETLSNIILDNIRSIDGVIKTITNIVLNI
ncbi:MAG: Lrp/AsnC family transcriptional regulator [Nitrospirota bacterium]